VRPRNDIAIYSPFAYTFYEGPTSSAGRDGSGGAELQATLLARHLARSGFKVAHIVYPVEEPAPPAAAAPEVVERPPRAAARGGSRLARGMGKLVDCLHVWRALAAAEARLYLFRTGLSGGSTGFVTGALFCLLHRRGLVFAASNDLDFIFGRDDRPWLVEALYRLALRRAQRVVVQTRRQLELAGRVVEPANVTLIPSFAEPADPGDAAAQREGFLWAGRLVDYKLPLRYIELARSVPEARFRMVVGETGETSDELASEVSHAAAQVPNLELAPRQARERVLEHIARCTAVVVTSRSEGMPNLFLEAWARGAPVLSLHFDPDGRIAEEGIGICAAGSWTQFVSAARQLWSDGALRREIGERGRAYVRRTHSPGVVAARWTDLLREALRRAAG
jgi:glycosyltransferase involved in cell wall biosynthesis